MLSWVQLPWWQNVPVISTGTPQLSKFNKAYIIPKKHLRSDIPRIDSRVLYTEYLPNLFVRIYLRLLYATPNSHRRPR
jgi:hypothetical protein